ncbi:D-alanyl-D-alanine carboxypeptidase/D-alanyl-D-alanine-endopeptidase [Vicingus serpentipes]|uniref:D-alanyl-D-alanine carboxypeptidase/D-alanyl-D-alanine-endopeptidase n=1 Tax=Vicingus serpentipes TaxID=1926625 RepID=A0A5C6RN85_9FLAO|nr:D-alanyl-D-alanine carboxypeptidase/D-alanyl-D-alanine-endopeptidase [Vicingus serpentipes]TXB63667.1 D-alanyl-D-alanine carboxypeptidase/D-alanyl-D-alanine-endopeptidase [Vicingus serpentipes]
MKLIISSFFSFLLTLGYSQTIQDLKNEVSKLVADLDLKNASISFYAIDLTNNQVVAGLNSNKSLVPASTTKLVTTASALEILGGDTRFKTQILHTGSIDTLCRVLNGDIIIKGGGDPSLGAERYSKHYGDFINQWAIKIKALGIDSINGRVIGDASCFTSQTTPSTWIWGDLGNYYGASPSGLSIYENTCKVEFESGKKNGDSTIITCVMPFVPEFNIENEVKSTNTKKDESYFYGAPFQVNRIAKGGIPLNKKGFDVKSSIPDPSLLAAFELDMEMRMMGVKLKDKYTTKRIQEFDGDQEIHLITKTYSPKLTDIINQTNTYSINLYAEHLLNQIGLKVYKSGDPESGTTAITNFWKGKGINVEGLYLNDGSGLSRFNAISAMHLVSILEYMKKSENYNEFYNSLPIAGRSGTIKSIGKKTFAENNLRAKSGYMTRARSYAGYVTTKSKRELAFALIVNNYNCTPYEMKKKMESLMIKLSIIND